MTGTPHDVTPPYVGTRTYEVPDIDGIAQWVAVAATHAEQSDFGLSGRDRTCI